MKRRKMKVRKARKQYKLLRLKDVLDLIHVSASTWWAGCREGRFPEPMKIGPRVTVWKRSDIQHVINGKKRAKKGE